MRVTSERLLIQRLSCVRYFESHNQHESSGVKLKCLNGEYCTWAQSLIPGLNYSDKITDWYRHPRTAIS